MKSKRKLLSMILAVMILTGTMTNTAFAAGNPLDGILEKGKDTLNSVVDSVKGKLKISFIDINFHWGKDYIQYLIDKDAVKGYTDGTFRPDANITRAEFTAILLRAQGNDPGAATTGYWADTYMKAAAQKGYVKTGEFDDVTRNITRGEMARMIVRASGESYPSNINDYAKQITDYGGTPSAFKEYVLKAYVTGIVQGRPDGGFYYADTATRAEACTMIVRLIDKSKRKIPELKKDITDIAFPKDSSIPKRLYDYPVEADKYGFYQKCTLEEGHKRFTDGRYGSELNKFYNAAKGYIEAYNNFDYRNNMGEAYKNMLMQYQCKTGTVIFDDGTEISNQKYVESCISVIKQYKILQKSRFLTDKSLAFVGGKEGNFCLRGTLQFIFTDPTDIKYFKSQYNNLPNVQLNKWYEVDMDVEMAKWNGENDFTHARDVLLGSIREIKED